MAEYLLRDWRSYRSVSSPDSRHTAGSISYTAPGLAATVGFLCLGCFSYFLINTCFGTFIPVELEKFGIAPDGIALLSTSIPAVLNMVITPAVSFRSDRLRTKIGRRMPYILASAPFLAVFTALMGWCPQLGAALERLIPALSGKATVGLLVFCTMGYQLAFLVVGSVIYYLFPDVIPAKFIGRFMALFQLTSSFCGFLFGKFLIGYGDNYLGYLCGAVSLFYLAMVAVMAFNVREGSYPPPPDGGGRSTLLDNIRTYARECYSIPFYYSFFIMMALSDVSMVCRAMFNTLYARNELGLSLGQLGEVVAYSGVVGVVLSYPVGALVDRFHALRLYAAGQILVIIVNIASFFLVNSYATFYVSSIFLSVVYTIQGASTIPVFVAILPKSQYGQFSSANALFRAAFMAVVSYGGGLFIRFMGSYQYLYLWDFIFTTLCMAAFVKLYADWKKLGGKERYVAPTRK